MNESTRERITPADVATYLRRHPKFLAGYPDLALSMAVPRDEGQATSLASYQLEVLRDKNRELNRRLQELYGNAQDNERLVVRTHQLCLALIRANSAADTLRVLVASLIEDFGSELVRLVLHTPVVGQDAEDWLQIVPAGDASLAPFRDFAAVDEPLCGRLQTDKLDLLFAGRASEVQSAALLRVPGRGLLAIGSADGNHFFPGMGTLFLRLIAEALAAALARYDV